MCSPRFGSDPPIGSGRVGYGAAIRILHDQRQNQGNLGLDFPEQKRTQTFEDQMLRFMADTKKILNNHEQRMVDMDIFQANTNGSLVAPLFSRTRLAGPNRIRDALIPLNVTPIFFFFKVS